MPRLLFEKTGNAVWISHLDLMRVFQRTFKRAGLQLKHTQGFNPRPSVSIALPLSVGVESRCELLDFELDGQQVPCEQITEALNRSLISGVRVRSCYDDGRKLRDLALLQCTVTLEYDNGVPAGALEAIKELFGRQEVLVPKKTKNGVQVQNIIPMLQNCSLNISDRHTIQIEAVVCCQNPTLNPMQLAVAIELYLPDYKADFVCCAREEIFDGNQSVFR